jgi:sugar O-acyltransferase (sialic acid O-acetyltransferase NeuD family)
MEHTATQIVIYGAGRGGHLVAEMLSFTPAIQVVGMVDDNSDLWGKMVAGTEVLGGKELMMDLWLHKSFDALVISIATPATMVLRQELYLGLKETGLAFINAIHPSAMISPSAQIGENNVISAGVVIGTLAQVGNNNRICAHCNIEHHSKVGDHNFFGSHCVTGGAITVKDSCVFGMGSILDSLLQIGSDVRVANGAVVMSDLSDGSVIEA